MLIVSSDYLLRFDVVLCLCVDWFVFRKKRFNVSLSRIISKGSFETRNVLIVLFVTRNGLIVSLVTLKLLKVSFVPRKGLYEEVFLSFEVRFDVGTSLGIVKDPSNKYWSFDLFSLIFLYFCFKHSLYRISQSIKFFFSENLSKQLFFLCTVYIYLFPLILIYYASPNHEIVFTSIYYNESPFKRLWIITGLHH